MESITVTLGKRSYPIKIGSGLLKNPNSFWPLQHGDNAVLITNDTLAQLYLMPLRDRLTQLGISIGEVILPDGEQYKSLEMLDKIFSFLLEKSYGRDTTLIALGGGVIGDLTGFAAASYQRGIRFIQVPTTLLSQVDASIGGKTAVNHPLGKNMIGAFHQPSSVIIDLDYLNTLPRREFSSGLSEVIKYSIIFDSDFFSWIEKHLDALITLHPESLAYCIRRCCELKAHVVKIDENEKNIRTLLNFGHTYGHAIETHLGYTKKWLHGEAISVGMMMAMQASFLLGKFSNINLQRVKKLLLRSGLPINGPVEMTTEDYWLHMMRDKKVLSGQLRLILPLELGKTEIYTNVEYNIIKASIEACQKC